MVGLGTCKVQRGLENTKKAMPGREKSMCKGSELCLGDY